MSESRNWAGTHRWTPADRVAPTTVDGVCEAVVQAREAGRRIRVVGSAHSFNAIAATDETQLSLASITGVVSADAATGRVTLGAGTTIFEAVELLERIGFAFPALGDTGYQTLAGATATGTHGSSVKHGTLSSAICGMEIVTAAGEAMRVTDGDPERLAAARLSLGALGPVTAITFQCVPSYVLRTVRSTMATSELLGRLDELLETHEHFEFWWMPHCDRALTVSRDPVDDPARPERPLRDWFDEIVLNNHLFGMVVRAGAHFPSAIPAMNRFSTATAPATDEARLWHRSFLAKRLVRLQEMEFIAPRVPGVELLVELITRIERDRLPVNFPVHGRFLAPEDTLLAPSAGKQAMAVGCMTHPALYAAAFETFERIARTVGALPHWGKYHGLGAEELARGYSGWDAFQCVRAQCDPDGLFGNPYTDRVLGPVT